MTLLTSRYYYNTICKLNFARTIFELQIHNDLKRSVGTIAIKKRILVSITTLHNHYIIFKTFYSITFH